MDKVSAINHYFLEMRPALLQTGLKETSVDLPELTEKNTEAIFTWIEEIYFGAFHDYVVNRSRVPEYVWENYKLLGVTDLPEQRLLKESLKELRTAWMEARPWRRK